MAIPSVSNFPTSLDSNINLYEVHDSLRVKLVEDYNPGDTSITVEDDTLVVGNFPDSGFITLTEQCSEVDNRAVTMHYTSHTETTFDGLTVFSDSPDVVKAKNITNVTQNVTDDHHNNLKDSLIAIEEFIGIQGTLDSTPFGDTMEGRINFIHQIALQPKAWFSVDNRIGIIPLPVEFTDLSFRTNTGCPVGTVSYIWHFGDSTMSTVSVISVTDVVPVDQTEVVVRDLDGGTINKTYTTPGIYSPSLTVVDDFGTDTVVFPDLIHARVAAPDEAVISITPRSNQQSSGGVLKSPINTLIDIEVPEGEIPSSDPSRSYSGELLDGNGNPIDPVDAYTWSLSDDLPHSDFRSTQASYSIGGLYDVILRTDTEFGAYRITKQDNVINIIENTNLWLWTAPSSASPNEVNAIEMGLISETYKTASSSSLTLDRDSSFLDSTNNEITAKREFNRNTGFAPRQTLGSGNTGSETLLAHAGGRTGVEAATTEEIVLNSYNGFTEIYTAETNLTRPWNWAFWASEGTGYFFLGNVTGAITADTSPTNQDRTALNLSNLSTSTLGFTSSNYTNGADELEENVAEYTAGIPNDGYFGVHRTAWKDNNGYLIRNSGVGAFFRLLSFYRAEGTTGSPFQTMTKLPNMLGTTKLEGQLLTLSRGVYFFNNSGNLSIYDTTAEVWLTDTNTQSGGFRSLQDNTVEGFDDLSNTLLAASDGDKKAYLSFDYSTKAVIKFNEADTTFSLLGPRPSGEQWNIGIF